jgi:hypothetical protein
MDFISGRHTQPDRNSNSYCNCHCYAHGYGYSQCSSDSDGYINRNTNGIATAHSYT